MTKIDRIKPPKGYEDAMTRKNLGMDLRRQIDSYNSFMSVRMESWQRTQDVYDGTLILSSINHLDEIEPYQIPLLKPRVDAVAASVTEAIISADPYFIVSGVGFSPDQEDQVEQTIQYALDRALFQRKIKDVSLMAALRSRGWMRLRYQTITEGILSDELPVDMMAMPMDEVRASEEGEVQKPQTRDVRYSGLVIETIMAEDMVGFPTFYKDVTEFSGVGHRFLTRRQDMLTKQQKGRYFDDVDIPETFDVKGYDQVAVTTDPKDYPALCYDLVVKLIPDGETEERRYRITLLYNTGDVLMMEPYNLPTVWYFSPAPRYQEGRFYPAQSIGESMMEHQTIFNDAYTLLILGTAAGSMPPAFVTGYTGDASEIRTGIGSLTTLPQGCTVTSAPIRFTPQACIEVINFMKNEADAMARFSQAGMGQDFGPSTTATEVNAVSMGQLQGISEFTHSFGMELERFGDFARWLLAQNFDAFKDFHGDAVKCPTADPLTQRMDIELNGKSQQDSPTIVMQKIMALLQSYAQLGVQPIPGTKGLNVDNVITTLTNTLRLPFSTSKFLQDVPNANQNPQGPPDGGNPGPGQVPPDSPAAGAQGQVPPEALLALLAHILAAQGQVPQGGMGGANPGMPPGNITAQPGVGGPPTLGIPVAGGNPGVPMPPG